MTGYEDPNRDRLKQHFAQRVVHQARHVLEVWQRLQRSAWNPADTAELVVTEMGHRPKRVTEGDVETGLTDQVDDSCKYRIFINTITSISLDDHNCIPTSDNRLLRRIVRDFNKGAFTARESIMHWPNVRRSEVQWIYPYQENADVMFNTAMIFEMSVLKSQVDPLLEMVPESSDEYSEAYRLRKFLSYLIPVANRPLPPTSLLREFLGGSTFKY